MDLSLPDSLLKMESINKMLTIGNENPGLRQAQAPVAEFVEAGNTEPGVQLYSPNLTIL